jgi:hypothetical protein
LEFVSCGFVSNIAILFLRRPDLDRSHMMHEK